LNARRLAYVGALTVNIVRRVLAQPRRRVRFVETQVP
jgi:hypothetical protein